ncbi:MAG: hypothetical protein QXR58_02110, partial [Candidatus Micrarchaeaceae archaeon]
MPILTLLLLVPTSYSASTSCKTPSSLPSALASGLSTAISVGFIAVLFSFSMVALSYMLGEVLKIESLKKWYKGELWETVKSILILVSIFSILIIGSGIAAVISGSTATFSLSGGQNAQGQSMLNNLAYLYSSTYCNYIQPQNTSMLSSFSYMYGLALGTDFLKNLALNLYVPIPIPIPPPPPPVPPIFAGFMFGSNAHIYVSSIIDTSGKSTSFLADFTKVVVVPLYFIFALQSQFFYTIVLLGLAFFLPFGIILRAIPIVRPIGGTLIAIGIGI